MAIDTQIQGNSARIIVPNFFDSSIYQSFKRATTTLMENPEVQSIAVDLSMTEYLDSSAIGILALLAENAKYAKKPARLICIPGRVLDILNIAHMSSLFEIELAPG